MTIAFQTAQKGHAALLHLPAHIFNISSPF